jgi:pyruvate/2-oxoglutarate dehydrogenase complex dihydrolipoamide acyltransferase (E2) component
MFEPSSGEGAAESAMAALNARTPAIWICACALAWLAGCERSKHDEMRWAKDALERNGRLQVVAVDPQTRAFTVRMKDTGELRIVQADEIVGSLPAAAPQAAAATAATAAPAKPPMAAPASTASAGNVPEPAAAPEAQVAATAAPIASGAGVIAAGPGYSIKSARTDATANARAGGFAPADSVAGGLAVERRDEPIVCQGARFLRIDSRNLEFAGDALSAEDGCEMHITNSRIAAKGVGVSARAANVHIENSSIEGQSGSILASEGAQVYAEASRFRGVSRGLTPESLHDLGGNVWN